MPRKTLSCPRLLAASSRWIELSSASGLGRSSSATQLFNRIQDEIQLQNVHSRFTEKAKIRRIRILCDQFANPPFTQTRSEEHTSELQSHSFISYAVFCLKKKT